MISAPSSRLPGYDLARALAVLGMVLVNFTSMMEVSAFSPAWLKPVIDFIFGRAAAVFVMLAGVSVSLMAARGRSPDAVRILQRRLLKRCLLLLIAGMLLWRWWQADILHFYAVFIATGAWAVKWRHGNLRAVTLGVFCISLPVCATLTSAYDLGDPVFALYPSRVDLVLLLDFLTSPYYAVFPWLGFFLAGMLLGRREPFSRSFNRRLCQRGAVLCMAVEFFSAAMMRWIQHSGVDIEGNWWIAFLRSEAFPATPLFVLSAGAGAVTLISLCRLAAPDPLRRIWGTRALTAAGRLSLTLYIAHIVWGMLLKHWMAGRVIGMDSRHLFIAVGTFDLAGIVFAAGWCRHFRRGPLEMLFHRWTAGKASDGDSQATREPYRGGIPLPR